MAYRFVAIFWMITLFIIYTCMVVIVPYFVLRPILKGKSVCKQFIICVVAGNFYYINIVLFLGLFHITSKNVYIAVFLLPFLLKAIRRREKIKEQYVTPAWRIFMGMVRGENSIKFCICQIFRWIKRTIKRAMRPICCVIKSHMLEGILFVVCMFFFVMYFAPYFYEHYGYRTSDMMVHQNWINAMDHGILFSDGIYPMGMHAIIYYIHEVFGIHTYILMQFFPFVSDIYIFVMLLVVIKSICRFRYTPYIGFFCLIGADYIQSGRLLRYMSALPQEFGMMFYLPCLTAAIHFFKSYMEENKEYKRLKEENLLYTQIGEKKRKKESSIWLWVLIISFGLTFAVHFYITILAGILLIAVAIGYIGYVFRPAYLKKLLLAAFLGIFLPMIPMILAFVGGTPLQGSLYWATSVMGIDLKDAMTGESSLEEETFKEKEDSAAEQSEERAEKESSENLMMDQESEELSLKEKIKKISVNLGNSMKYFYVMFIFKNETIYQIFLIGLLGILIQIPLMFLFKEREYGRILTVVLINQILASLVGISEQLGLPVLIDAERMSGFLAYATPICLSLAVDSYIVWFFKIGKKKQLCQGISFCLAVGFIGYSVQAENIRKAEPQTSSLQTDGAAICLYDIINNYPERKWTIVSCNEERTMMGESGWHYEVIDFLQSMEHYKADDVIEIPTKYVFFYIEKESLNYAYKEWKDFIDPTVSEKWADHDLPEESGTEQYSGTNRIILNSRMYYWMQEYRKRYPDEVKIFYEDDNFVCYFIEQNEYYLHNFAIDYGFNER